MHRLSRLFSLPSTALFAVLLAPSAKADTLTTFDVVGTFESGAKLSGTVTIDTTIGSVTAANLAASSPYFATLTTVGAQRQNYGGYAEDEVDVTNGTYTVSLAFLSSTLVGYQGGSLGSRSTVGLFSSGIAFNGNFLEDLYVGSTTAPAAVTPEPSSLILLATGLVGLAGAGRRRFGNRTPSKRETSL